MHDLAFALAVVTPVVDAVDIVVRNPHAVVVAVADRVVRVTHPRQRAACGALDRKPERPPASGIEVVAGQLDAVALQRHLVVRQRHRLKFRYRFGIGQRLIG